MPSELKEFITKLSNKKQTDRQKTPNKQTKEQNPSGRMVLVQILTRNSQKTFQYSSKYSRKWKQEHDPVDFMKPQLPSYPEHIKCPQRKSIIGQFPS